MFRFLKSHPFAVEAFFTRSLVISYALPLADVKKLIPPCLEPDSWQDRYGFVAAAFVQTKHLRPKSFPQFMGHDFFLAGYRVFVNYYTQNGKRLRGLYILGSETDTKKMEWLGNCFTNYRYSTTDLTLEKRNNTLHLRSKQSGIDLLAETNGLDSALPLNSPFQNWKEARRFAGPLPFTFSYDPYSRKVLIIEGVRHNWEPEPVEIKHADIGFFKTPAFQNAIPANSFQIQNVPYYWKKGKTDVWKPHQIQ
ncbi:MAG: DUF2071 domain-containing protein [Sediminibacterium sp.]|nr:DUF2071 domain-containing protein [Sediminibacterium sp.]